MSGNQSASMPARLGKALYEPIEPTSLSMPMTLHDMSDVGEGTSTTYDSKSLIFIADKGIANELEECLESLISQEVDFRIIQQQGWKETALHRVARHLHVDSLSRNIPTYKSRFGECLKILLQYDDNNEKTSLNSTLNALQKKKNISFINRQNKDGNTALHFAARSGEEDAVLLLLEQGANVLVKNNRGRTPLEFIRPSTLEMFLDRCIITPESGESWQDFYLLFNYNFLAQTGQPDDDFNSVASTTKVPYVNPECSVPMNLIRSPKHAHLMKHPLIASFVLLKWHTVRFFVWLNLILSVLYAVTSLCTFYFFYNSWGSNGSDADEIWTNFFSRFLVACVSAMLFRDVLQFVFCPLCYFFDYENYVRLAMLGFTVLVQIYWNDPNWTITFAAVALLLAWTYVWLLVGRIFGIFSVFLATLWKVGKSYMELLLFCSILITGFASSLYLIFKTPRNLPGSQGVVTSHLFPNLSDSGLRFVAMMNGHLDYDNLPFHIHPYTSRVIFFVLVIFINIILVNLLTGWSVCDIQDVKSKAETLAYVSLLKSISSIESLFLGSALQCHNRAASMVKYFYARETKTGRFLQLIHSPILTCLMSSKCMRLAAHTLARKLSVVIFTEDCLKDKILLVDLNSKIHSRFPPPENPDHLALEMCSCHDTFNLDDKLLENALQATRRCRNGKDSFRRTITSLQDQVKELLLKLETIEFLSEEDKREESDEKRIIAGKKAFPQMMSDVQQFDMIETKSV